MFNVYFLLIALAGMPTLNLLFSDASSPKFRNRWNWGARQPMAIDYVIIPVENIIIHHTATRQCNTTSLCDQLLTSIQTYNMEMLGLNDIKYNFMVGGDGVVYEGVGWHRVGSHTKGYDVKSLGIAFIGNFNNELPNKQQLQAVIDFIEYGVEIGEIDTNYRLFGARQIVATQSPGLKLYREIEKWPHFSKSL